MVQKEKHFTAETNYTLPPPPHPLVYSFLSIFMDRGGGSRGCVKCKVKKPPPQHNLACRLAPPHPHSLSHTHPHSLSHTHTLTNIFSEMHTRAVTLCLSLGALSKGFFGYIHIFLSLSETLSLSLTLSHSLLQSHSLFVCPS